VAVSLRRNVQPLAELGYSIESPNSFFFL
jgi:hypothetical protein